MKHEKPLDLDNPGDARLFLRGVRICGRGIEVLQLKSGAEIPIDQLNDEQAVRYAKDIYIDYCGGVEGEGGFIDLETEGLNQ